MSTVERIDLLLLGLPHAPQPAWVDSLYAEIGDAIATEKERCAKIADSMDSVQNIGDRIRHGLGQETEEIRK